AVVITSATLCSLLVSFTLTPMLARFSLRPPGDSAAATTPLARFGRVWDAGFAGLEHRYERLLAWSIPHRWIVIAVGMASFAAGISLLVFGLIGLDFFPSGDQSELDLTLTMPASTSLEASNTVAQDIEARLRAYPEVRSLYTVVGQTSVSGSPT